MSRIDYFTVAIVGVCIVAIIFLVYRMSDLFRTGEQESASLPAGEQMVEVEDEGMFDYMEDGAIEMAPAAAGGAVSDTTAEPSATDLPDAVAEEDAPLPPAPETEERAGTSASVAPEKGRPDGDFMVFAGTFRQRNLAERRLDKLRQLGYGQARMEVFDRGRFAVIIVDQFRSRDSADALVRRLATDDIRSYVKLREQ